MLSIEDRLTELEARSRMLENHRVHYLREPLQREPGFGVTSVNYDYSGLLARAGEPS
jgi:hypothetical protein